METSTFGPVTDWNEVIKKEARGLNDADLGEVQEVDENYVLTQRGTISKEKFCLPKSIPHGYNGRLLLFDITHRRYQSRSNRLYYQNTRWRSDFWPSSNSFEKEIRKYTR